MIRLSTVRMTSPLEIQIVEKQETRAVRRKARKAFEAALAEVDRLTRLLSEYRADSEISHINRNAGRTSVLVSLDTANVIELALETATMTRGAFDPTFRPLLDLWDYNQEDSVIPAEESIQKTLQLVDYGRVEFDKVSRRIRLAKPGMRLGLGGVSKGYIVQKIVETLKQFNFENFLVNAGGDIFASGTHLGKSWNVGVPDPIRPGRMAFSVPISNVAFCTSACYERYVTINGKQYGHILHPKTGYPVEYTQGVTVIAHKMGYADAIATTIFVLGPFHGLQFANQLQATEAIIFDAQGRMHMTDGLNRVYEEKELPLGA
ncbi:MAG: FAD:protein FMN transferase [SAR324 cluster bacterium]|nr:FAD:protein FMN transferase [SAR324 cluster bacterium]